VNLLILNHNGGGNTIFNGYAWFNIIKHSSFDSYTISMNVSRRSCNNAVLLSLGALLGLSECIQFVLLFMELEINYTFCTTLLRAI